MADWKGDRQAQIQLARTIAHQAPRATAAQQEVADQSLASYLRVCCSEFQAFCAALFDEAVNVIRRHLNEPEPSGNPRVRPEMSLLLVNTLGAQTRLSTGNPNSSNLLTDFDRIGVNARKAALVAVGPATAADLVALDDQLLVTRNKILHGEVRMDAAVVGNPPRPVREPHVNGWVKSLDRIADTLDSVVARDLTAPLGARPW